MSCYGDGNGEFELNFHVITVACLSIDLLLDENTDKVEGRDCSVVISSCSPCLSRAPI